MCICVFVPELTKSQPKPIDLARINRAKSESPDMEADALAMVLAVMAEDVDVDQAVDMVIVI